MVSSRDCLHTWWFCLQSQVLWFSKWQTEVLGKMAINTFNQLLAGLRSMDVKHNRLHKSALGRHDNR
jgi:hypothetical protein